LIIVSPLGLIAHTINVYWEWTMSIQ
jgi:hypothetical protein